MAETGQVKMCPPTLKGMIMSLRLTSSALALMAFAMPAFADVTPEEVWQTWLDYYKSTGYTVTEGSHDLAGETLTVKDIKFSTAVEGDTVEFTIPQITLQATGDGKVRTVYADTIPLTFSGTNVDTEEPFSGKLTMSMPGNETVTSGAVGDMTHDMVMPQLVVTLDEVKTGDKTPDIGVKFTATNSSGKMHTVAGSDAKYTSSMVSEKAELTMNVTDENEGKVNLTASMSNLEMGGNVLGVAAAAEMQSNMAAALNKGFALDATMKVGQTEFAFDFAKPESAEEGTPAQNATGKGSIAGFDFAVNMSKDGLGYQVNSDKTQTSITSSDLPFPINYGIDSSSFDLQFPVSKSDTPAPFKVAYSINGVTFGDEIWDLFDAGKQLPRDPASIDVDLTGTLKVIQDLFDPKVMDAGSETTIEDEAIADGETGEVTEDMTEDYVAPPSPVEPVEITINQLALSAVGAKITAHGSLKPSESGGIEAPVGTINARYEGVNGLIDKLGKMGLIPEDQMAGVRMMLAMFARPGEGTDVLTTDVEFKEDGSVFANGQQVK